jgi:hypothetical protein
MSSNDSTDEERALTGAGGDDVSAGTSVSGVGGEATRTESEEAGLRPVHEQGRRIGWGRDAEEGGDQPMAGDDGTGQSEKPPAE